MTPLRTGNKLARDIKKNGVGPAVWGAARIRGKEIHAENYNILTHPDLIRLWCHMLQQQLNYDKNVCSFKNVTLSSLCIRVHDKLPKRPVL